MTRDGAGQFTGMRGSKALTRITKHLYRVKMGAYERLHKFLPWHVFFFKSFNTKALLDHLGCPIVRYFHPSCDFTLVCLSLDKHSEFFAFQFNRCLIPFLPTSTKILRKRSTLTAFLLVPCVIHVFVPRDLIASQIPPSCPGLQTLYLHARIFSKFLANLS